MTDLFGLRKYQSDAVCDIESAWQTCRAVCYQAPTGSGKSKVIRQIVDNHRNANKKIYVVAHRRNLVKQLSRELEEGGIRHGLITANAPMLNYRVQVCSLQTMTARLDRLADSDILIFDEAHHCKASSYLNIINRWPDAKILGLTATPARTDKKPLRDIFQHLIIGPPPKQLIAEGHLSDYEYYAPSEIDTEGLHRSFGDFKTDELRQRTDRKIITGSAIEHYQRHADHLPAIAACVDIAHAEHVAEQFREAGYRAQAVHSKMDEHLVDKYIAGLADGSVEILCNSDLIGEGTDIPAATVLIGLRLTDSVIIFLQHIGRVMRRAEGKGKAIILDHVGNWKIHGLPDDDREWSLDAPPRKPKSEATLKRCPGCLRPVPIATRICPYCSHEWVREYMPRALPKQVDGQLVDVRAGMTGLVTRIAREARSLQDALRIAREIGAGEAMAVTAWTKYLKMGG